MKAAQKANDLWSVNFVGSEANIAELSKKAGSYRAPVFTVMSEEIYKRLRQNVRDMEELKNAYETEFPVCVGYTGYQLTAAVCGKGGKKCPLCPHSLYWKRFDYTRKHKDGSPLFWWEKEYGKTLPWRFISSRTPKVAERFTYYNERVKILNKRRQKLMQAYNAVRAAHRSIMTSALFNGSAPADALPI
jgi:hypothetical protein